MINLKQEVEGKDADGIIIKDKHGNIPVLKDLLIFALRQPHPQDQQTGLEEKATRGQLARRIESSDEIELTLDERDKTLARVGLLYLQADLVCAIQAAITSA